MDKLVSAIVDAIIAHGALFIAMAIAIWFLWAQEQKRAKANDILLAALAKERDERLTEIEKRAEACDLKHDLAQRKYERVLAVLAKIPDVDANALFSTLPKSHLGV